MAIRLRRIETYLFTFGFNYLPTTIRNKAVINMPKIKSFRGAKKRFKLTSKGKVRRKKANASHILTKKTTKRKRNLRKSTFLSKADEKRIKRLIP